MDRQNTPFTEHELRKQLSNLYASMVESTGNAELLIDRDPGDIEYGDTSGNSRTRKSMIDACEWLADVQFQCRDPGTFEDVIMGAVRKTARYLVSVRKRKPTTSLEGWVFQKSKVLENAYGQRMAMAMIVPQLESCMSVRLPDNVAEDMDKGYFYRFFSATPMPITNRLHVPTHRIERTDTPPRLSDWDFLKTAFADRGRFSDSLEMDVCCEIASIQSRSAHHLGTPIILAGTVLSADESDVTIQDIEGNESFAVVRSDQEQHAECSLQDMVGMPARFLVVEWYQPGKHSRGTARFPELLWYEAGDLQDLRNDDLVGYVRLRGSVDLGTLHDRYGTVDVSKIGCLSENGGAIRYIGMAVPADPVVGEFLESVREIRETWLQYRRDSGLPVTKHDVISDDNANTAAMTSKLEKKPEIKNTLSDIQAVFDATGNWAAKLDHTGEYGLKRHVRQLVRIDLLHLNGDSLEVTPTGRRILGMVLEGEMKRYLSSLDCLYIPELDSHIPRSILLRHLKDTGDFSESPAEWGKNKLLWVRSGATANPKIKEYEDNLTRHHNLILRRLRTVNHPANPKFVHDELAKQGEGIDYLSAGIMLDQLHRIGKLTGSEDSWEYDIYWRIRDLISEDRDGEWTSDRVMAEIRAPLPDRKKAGDVLANLEKEGLIVKLAGGVWVWRKDGVDQRRVYVSGRIKQKTLFVLAAAGKRGIDCGTLVGRVYGTMHDQLEDFPVAVRKQLVVDSIHELKNSNAIQERDGLYYITADRPQKPA